MFASFTTVDDGSQQNLKDQERARQRKKHLKDESNKQDQGLTSQQYFFKGAKSAVIGIHLLIL